MMLKKLQNLKINHLVILTLLAIIFLQIECDGKKVGNSIDPLVKVDTQYVSFDNIIEREVPIYVSIPDKIPEELKPSDDCNTLKIQYNSLSHIYSNKNVYKDTLDLKEFGNIEIIDTIQYNRMGKRTFNQNLKFPVVTKTVIEKEEPRIKVYAGGNIGVYGRPSINPGLMLQTKKDQIYTLNGGINDIGEKYIMVGTYWKISFKRKR